MAITKLLANGAFDPEATHLLGAAFEEAWRTLEAAESPLADEEHATATREILAKTIILFGRQGERDMDRLVEGALTCLAVSSGSNGSDRLVAFFDVDPDLVEALRTP